MKIDLCRDNKESKELITLMKKNNRINKTQKKIFNKMSMKTKKENKEEKKKDKNKRKEKKRKNIVSSTESN